MATEESEISLDDELNDKQKKAIVNLVSEDGDLQTTKRDFMQLAGGGVMGALLGYSGNEIAQPAKADASTSDSDGNVGQPNDPVDAFLDGATVETELGIPVYSNDSNPPNQTFYYNDSDSEYKYKDTNGTVQVQEGALADSGSDNTDGGNIYNLPQAEDSIDLQGQGDITGVSNAEVGSATVTDQSPSDDPSNPTLFFSAANTRLSVYDLAHNTTTVDGDNTATAISTTYRFGSCIVAGRLQGGLTGFIDHVAFVAGGGLATFGSAERSAPTRSYSTGPAGFELAIDDAGTTYNIFVENREVELSN